MALIVDKERGMVETDKNKRERMCEIAGVSNVGVVGEGNLESPKEGGKIGGVLD